MAEPINLRDLLKMAQDVSRQPGGNQQMAVALRQMQTKSSSSQYSQLGQKPATAANPGQAWAKYDQLKTSAPASTPFEAQAIIKPSRKGAAFLLGCAIGILIVQAWFQFPGSVFIGFFMVPITWLAGSIGLQSEVSAQFFPIVMMVFGCIVYGSLMRLLEIIVRRDLGGA